MSSKSEGFARISELGFNLIVIERFNVLMPRFLFLKSYPGPSLVISTPCLSISALNLFAFRYLADLIALAMASLYLLIEGSSYLSKSVTASDMTASMTFRLPNATMNTRQIQYMIDTQGAPASMRLYIMSVHPSSVII
jgi:hypothetical protein